MIALGSSASPSRKQAVVEPSAARVVARPIPQAQLRDPRGYQLEALRRRFKPSESTTPDGACTSLRFRLKPSDPDFPFDLDALECDVLVPQDYPDKPPELLVRNKDVPRGFGINIERGFARLAEERGDKTLLALVHALDRNLEGFLSEQKADTVKLVPFKDTRHLQRAVKIEAVGKGKARAEEVAPATPQKPYVPEPSFSRAQINDAKARRAQEIRQLEARMGRMPQFRRSADGVIFSLPVEPKRRGDLAPGLRAVKSIHLIVPLLYPLQRLRVQLDEADAGDAEPVEELFAERAAQQKHMSLMSHVNYLVQNLHILAGQARLAAEAEAEAQKQQQRQEQQQQQQQQHVIESVVRNENHLQIVQRPPEWWMPNSDAEDSENGSYDEEEDDHDHEDEEGEEEEGEGEDIKTAPPAQAEQDHGTMISFPGMELRGIELLEISSLSISVKCERCKTSNDVNGLRPGAAQTSSCSKCGIPLAAKYTARPMHEHSLAAGFIDASGCKVGDMLPSTFIPTCSKCSTTSNTGLVSVRGEMTSNVCRGCHGRFTFTLPQVKFLLVSPGTALPTIGAGGRRTKQEKLGLHAGEPLPERGACAHYRKSYRWFRFSCCNRVHACDRCHDEAEGHANEWAARMICGLCSREQKYDPEACGFCGRSVIGKKGKGFWEGGRGTRDQRTMSRKDPRKYKRLHAHA